MSDAYTEKDRNNARFLRLAVVTNLYRQGVIDKADAYELLSGPLTPGDDSTIADDRALLDQDAAVVMQLLGIEVNNGVSS